MSAFEEALHSESDLTSYPNRFDEIDNLKGEAIYDRNVDLLNYLENGRIQDETYKRRENLYRRIGPYITGAPFAVTTAYVFSPMADHIESLPKISYEALSGFGSFMIGLFILNAYEKTRKFGQKKAQEAAKESQRLNNMNQPWITRRLEEKEADELREKRMRGEAI